MSIHTTNMCDIRRIDQKFGEKLRYNGVLILRFTYIFVLQGRKINKYFFGDRYLGNVSST